MELKPAFGTALKLIRNRRGMSQEDFSVISSRTYLSSLERGLKCPTIEKVEDLAAFLNVHPLTVLAVAYTIKDSAALETLMHQVKGECEWIFCNRPANTSS
ncbi:transcriptional regulator with XRE-family HTH domain [Pseudomonas sp. GGS8]|jgi:transcriptional regulator with XRE-family HTH domain|uniref:helix-turn-helix domain-containing protein n=1 Tax=unclassified Pseudomonas TaxID=196821 RepID=UPI0020A073AC|nr:helix-turn-helix transcriptional regulator [Pseudomonas sp. GGS8]MCP1443156.1 transcriptional regulator with XRE-family HTH domain [Pseudomonas sp. GGS8]